MKAAVFREYNKDPTKVVKIEDIDVPKLKSNEVLIKVESASYNYNDLWAIWGDPVKTPLPHISGSDVAGTVVEIGEDTTKFKVGDRVVSHSNMSCRICEQCTAGREYDCKERTIWGFQTGPLWGGFAQYTHLPEVNVAKLPENVSFEDAAAISMVGMTAWHMLVGRAKIIPGQTVLIMGGTSGVGMAGIQIAKLYNCNVIATAGREYDCKERTIWGFQTGPLWGGFAQYTHLPEVNVAKLPENVSFEDAAAISMVGMTAWHMLVGRARIIPGQTVLIMGGTSGVGMAGIQIAKLYNCNVIATAGNQQKMDKCLELGADNVVNHREADWYKKVREFTKKEGVDVVFEHIGKNVFPQEVGLLKMGGTLVATGATTGYDSALDLRYLFFKGTNLLGSTQGTKAELEQVIYWLDKNKIKPLIATTLPFSNMVEGHVMMAGAEQIGKILTTPQKL